MFAPCKSGGRSHAVKQHRFYISHVSLYVAVTEVRNHHLSANVPESCGGCARCSRTPRAFRDPGGPGAAGPLRRFARPFPLAKGGEVKEQGNFLHRVRAEPNETHETDHATVRVLRKRRARRPGDRERAFHCPGFDAPGAGRPAPGGCRGAGQLHHARTRPPVDLTGNRMRDGFPRWRAPTASRPEGATPRAPSPQHRQEEDMHHLLRPMHVGALIGPAGWHILLPPAFVLRR